MDAFVAGYILGFAFIVFIGPVLFTLIQATLQWGYKVGMGVALGIIVSDVIAVVLCYYGAAMLFQDKEVQWYIALGGAALLTAMGLKYLIAPPDPHAEQIKPGNRQVLAAFIKGFLVNGVNPFVFIVWIGVIGTAGQKYGYDADLWLYLTGALLAIFINDVAKVLLAHYIKPFLKGRALEYIYRGVGGLLVVFAVILVVRVWIDQHPAA